MFSFLKMTEKMHKTNFLSIEKWSLCRIFVNISEYFIYIHFVFSLKKLSKYKKQYQFILFFNKKSYSFDDIKIFMVCYART